MNFVSYMTSLYQRKPGTGILEDVSIFEIPNYIKNKVLFYYKFDIFDVVEITYNNESIFVSEFSHTRGGIINEIKQELDRLTSYFEAAGLTGRRFLYDTTLKLAVSYSDFIPNKTPFYHRDKLAIVTDKKEGYITDRDIVILFSSSHIVRHVNNAVISLYINTNNITQPKNNLTEIGCLSTAIISGLICGLPITDIEKLKLETTVSISNKITEKFPFGSEFVTNFIKEINLGKLMGSFYSRREERNEFSGTSVNITRLIDIGLNRFIISLDDPNKKIEVNIDFPVDMTMYIHKGAAFVTLNKGIKLEDVKGWLNSDEIYEIVLM